MRSRTGTGRGAPAVLAGALAVACCAPGPALPAVRVGSKSFTEGVILGELLTQLAREAGAPARHRRELGGTQIVWGALVRGEIDAYVEYTGTLAEEVFGGRVEPAIPQLAAAAGRLGVLVSEPLGFANTYALGMRAARARELEVATIEDLTGLPGLRFGFTNEFMNRGDGWPGLRRAYSLPQTAVAGMEHTLAYRALSEGAIDVTDLYTTDPEIAYFDLAVLEDVRGYFPDYRALIVYRAELERARPEVVGAWRRLEGRLEAETMIRLNGLAQLERRPEQEVAAEFLREAMDVSSATSSAGLAARLWGRTAEHLALVGISLTAALLLALPLGILAARRPRLGGGILAAVGIVQTIPSLALLVFMIPVLGIGAAPAIAALFLYSLLPIVRNTATGLTGIPGSLLESADALGLPARARLRLVELPIATPTILAGIKTAAVINVGTATLGALIGAGGYGQPILTGIRLDDVGLILEGAVPAALLALAVQGAFALVERYLVPRGLRI